jgi:GT2 family glycosyltransferase
LISCLQNYPDVGVVGYLGGCLNKEGVGTSPAWGYDVDYISGWCLAIRRSDYEKFGLFDDVNLEFAYCEDADFCFRLREQGLTTYAFSLNLVWHKGHATSLAVDPNVLGGPFVRNHAYMRHRWQKYLGRSFN